MTLADLLAPGKPRRLARVAGVAGFALPCALLTLLGGCSIDQTTGFQSMPGRGHASRAEPAGLSTATADELTASGYEQIGIVQVRQRVRHCQDERCWDLPHDQDATSVARRLAADKGGDLIQLARDNDIERRERDTRGRCTSRMPAGMLSGPGTMVMGGDCVAWESVHEVWEYRLSEGTVWRKSGNGG